MKVFATVIAFVWVTGLAATAYVVIHFLAKVW